MNFENRGIWSRGIWRIVTSFERVVPCCFALSSPAFAKVRPASMATAGRRSLWGGRPAWWSCLHTAGLGPGSAAETDPELRAAPDASGTCATCCPSEGAVQSLTRVAAPRAWPCSGVEPSQSSPHSMASGGALWTERCWLASVLRRCRPRRTTRRAAPRPPPRAAVVARPRRRSVLTFKTTNTIALALYGS